MSLRDTLETSFSGDGLDADALLQQVAELYSALDLPESAFDPASIADQLQVLGNTDPSDISGLLDASLDAAGVAIEALPGAGEGLAALREAIAGLDALGHGATGLLDGLRDALTGTRPDETAVERAARAMTEIGGIDGLGPDGRLAVALPGAHLDRLGPAEGVLAAAGGLPPALAAIEGLMGLVAGLDRVVALRQAVAGLPDAASIANLRADVAAWDVPAIVDRIASGDPVDAIVADVAPALSRLRDLEQALAALVAGSAAVVGRLDPAAVKVAWRAADGVLGALDPAPVRVLAERLTAGLGGLLQSVPDATIPTADAFAAEVDTLLDGLTDAMAAVPSDRFTQGIAAGAAQVTAPIQVAADALDSVRSGVLEAEDAVGGILEAIDITPITDAVNAFTGPVTTAVEDVRAAFAAVSAALATGATTAAGVIGDLRSGADEVAATLGDAFGAVAGALDDLDLAARLEQVRTALEPVAQALDEVRIADAADAAAQGIESVAAVIDALPIELLPDSARTELDAATAPLKAFDFDSEVRSRVAAMLEEIESAIDVEVLDQVRAAQTEAAAFIASIDPRPAIEGLERETFTPALERIHAVDPDAALAPVRDAIARIPDLSHLLDPADQRFDALLEGYDRFSPRPLLQPVVAPLAVARAAVAEQLRLDATRARVEAVRVAALGAVDEVNVAHWLDALAQAAAAALPGSGGAAGAPLGQLVLRLAGHDTSLDPRTFAMALDLLSGRAASTALTESAATTRDALATLRATLGDLDDGSLLGGLQPGYDAIEAAIAALPAGALRRRLDALLPPSPASLAARLARARGDAIEQVAGALTISSQLAAFDLHRIEAAVTGLREALAPLKAVLDWLLAWVRRAGVVVDPANLAASVEAALDAIRSRVRGAVGLRMQAQLRESLRAAVTAIVESLLAAVDRLSEALEALDPEPLVAELDALHAAKRTELAALRPSTRLADVVTALRALEHDLRTFDPLADVRPVLEAFRVAADAVATELRPSILLAPAIESYERVATTITAADVDDLFGGVLDGLHRVTDEVGDGMDDVGMAFGRLQAALP